MPADNNLKLKDIKMVILDRDGVINFDSKNYIKSPQEWKPIPSSLGAIATIKKLGIKIAIATNQSGIGRNYFSPETLNEIHAKMLIELKKHGATIDEINFCPHLPSAKCNCRKPEPLLLLKAMQKFNIKPENTIMVGDSHKDMLASRNAKCHAALVKTGNGLHTMEKIKSNDNILIFENLAEFAEKLEREVSIKS